MDSCSWSAARSSRLSRISADNLVVDFFNHVNMLYGTISEFCTPEKVCLYPHSVLFAVELTRDIVYGDERWTQVRGPHLLQLGDVRV